METQDKFSYKVSRKDLAAIAVYNTGFQKCPPGYQWGPGQRDHYLIHYIISGKGTYTVDRQTYEVHAGEAFLAVPETLISYRADQKDPWNYCWVGFNGIDARTILNHSLFRNQKQSPVIPVDFGNEIEQSIHRMWDIRGLDFGTRIRMTGELYHLLSLFVTKAEHSSYADRYFSRAVDYIRKNYSSYTLSIEELSDVLGINRSYLYSIFRDNCGMSPKNYLTQFRMQQAKNLLVDTDLSIKSISYSVGYEDNMYFSKVFKGTTGLTPSRYRTLHRMK